MWPSTALKPLLYELVIDNLFLFAVYLKLDYSQSVSTYHLRLSWILESQILRVVFCNLISHARLHRIILKGLFILRGMPLLRLHLSIATLCRTASDSDVSLLNLDRMRIKPPNLKAYTS
jgi:hypothetical protein